MPALRPSLLCCTCIDYAVAALPNSVEVLPKIVSTLQRSCVDYGVAALDNWVEMLPKIVFTPVPVVPTASTATSAMRATSNAYSSRS